MPLMENVSRAFFDAVRRSMRCIREVIGETQVDPELLMAAERLQYEVYKWREHTNAMVRELSGAGVPIKAISRRSVLSRGLMRVIVGWKGSSRTCSVSGRVSRSPTRRGLMRSGMRASAMPPCYGAS
jgi:hypothetical protein